MTNVEAKVVKTGCRKSEAETYEFQSESKASEASVEALQTGVLLEQLLN